MASKNDISFLKTRSILTLKRNSQSQKNSNVLSTILDNEKSNTQVEEVKVEKEINYREELTLYFYKELLKYIVDTSDCNEIASHSDSDEEPEKKPEVVDEGASKVSFPNVSQITKLTKGSTIPSRKSNKSLKRDSTVRRKNKSADSTLVTLTEIFDPTNVSIQATLDNRNNSFEAKPIDGDYVSQTQSSAYPESECIPDDGLPVWYVRTNNKPQTTTIKLTSGILFNGEILRHKFEGVGCLQWPDGARYEGEFKNGEITGFGKLVYNTLCYYEGKFINGVLDGFGIFSPANIDMQYTGNFSNGRPHGQGRCQYKGNDYYSGNWVNGLKTGIGTRVYESGTIYCGKWHRGYQNGDGCMLFYNKDYYEGKWLNGLPNGYGEYTWSSRLNEGTTFTIENQYFGNFNNGVRDGYGIQIFGMEGSKLASIFDDDLKSGAGVMVCGDGTTIEKKPLFIMNNPSQKNKCSYNQIIPYKIAKQFRASSATRIKSTLNMICDIQYDQKLQDTFGSVDSVPWPITLPIHATALNMNLSYHVLKMYSKYLVRNEHRLLQFESSKVSEKDGNSPLSTSQMNEIRLLSRVVANNYVYLKEVYNKYCTLNPLEKFCPEYNKPVMSRLHLWQFLRDIEIHKLKITLYDVDLMLLEVPNIHLESEHDPGENIYFWQFIHCLMALSYKAYCTKEFVYANIVTGAYQAMFRKFIDEFIVPNEGRFEGRCLFHFRDLVPIKAVHGLYQSLDEPRNARQLLNRICHKRGEEPLSCKIKKRYVYDSKTQYKHYVMNGSKMIYMPSQRKNPWEPRDTIELNKYADDPFYTDLRVFRVLGAKKVMQSICRICQNVKNGKDIVFIDHYITFLEFHEILIDLAIELKEHKEKKEETGILTISKDSETIPVGRHKKTDSKILKKKTTPRKN